VEAVLDMQNDEQRQVITSLYLWWFERCGVREGEKKRDGELLAALIRSYAEEWSSIGRCEKGLTPTLKYQWKPPVDELNCDGAYKLSDKSGGWGFVIRGADGGVISSGYGVLSNVGETFHAELCACLHAVQRAADLGDPKGDFGNRCFYGGAGRHLLRN
jgi:hypothetical protein